MWPVLKPIHKDNSTEYVSVLQRSSVQTTVYSWTDCYHLRADNVETPKGIKHIYYERLMFALIYSAHSI